jgi:hypothetical protein
MSRRLLLVLGALALLGAALWDAPGIGRSGAFLAVLLLETLALLVASLARLVATPAPSPTIDARPADGLVPLVPLAGVEGVANEVDPSIKLYRGLTPSHPVARPKGSRAHRSPLLGRVGLFSIFVGRDGSGWSDQEVIEAFDSLARTGRWIEREAWRWGAPVNLEIVDTVFRGDDPEPETVELTLTLDPFENVLDEADADVRGISSASRAVAGLGFADLADLIARVDPRTDHDRTVWFVHLLRAGRSSAVAADRFRYPGVGLALCYARESAASGPLVGLPYVDPATLAHEFLHLFGASDKYGTSLRSFPPKSVTSRDIMRLDHDRLGSLRIDPLTASEIGWTTPEAVRAANRPASTRA